MCIMTTSVAEPQVLNRTRDRISAIKNPITSVETLIRVFERTGGPSAKEKIALIGNKKFPDQYLEKLLTDPSVNVRVKIALTATNQDFLDRLLVDPDLRVVSTIAWNPAARPEILNALTKNPKLPLKAKRGVAQNRNAPLKTLQFLLATAHETSVPEQVFMAQIDRLGLTPTEIESYPTPTRIALAKNRNKKVAPFLDTLIADDNLDVRTALAGSQHISSTAFKEMSENEEDLDVAATLLYNSKSPAQILETLTDRFQFEKGTLSSLVYHQNVTRALIEKIWWELEDSQKTFVLDTKKTRSDLLILVSLFSEVEDLKKTAIYFFRNPEAENYYARRYDAYKKFNYSEVKNEMLLLLHPFFPEASEAFPMEWLTNLAEATFNGMNTEDWKANLKEVKECLNS